MFRSLVFFPALVLGTNMVKTYYDDSSCSTPCTHADCGTETYATDTCINNQYGNFTVASSCLTSDSLDIQGFSDAQCGTSSSNSVVSKACNADKGVLINNTMVQVYSRHECFATEDDTSAASAISAGILSFVAVMGIVLV